MQRDSKPTPRPGEGIEVRHAAGCPKSNGGARCRCAPSYRAEVYDRATRRRVRRTFPTLAAAKTWRADAAREVKARRLSARRAPTFNRAADAFLDAARDGRARARTGEHYKPSALRGYEEALRLRLRPALGALPLDEIEPRHLRALTERMLAEGMGASTVRNTINAARVVYRYALAHGARAANPCEGLDLPATPRRRERIPSVAEAAELLDALPEADRALWATFFYAGLRCGEARALTWGDVDLKAGVLRVRATWDRVAGPVPPKSRAGRRDVPLPATLGRYLREHRLRTGRTAGLVFGRTEADPFSPEAVVKRARRVWKEHDLEALTPHDARHAYASFSIEAAARSGGSVNVKALSEYMGHASIAITYDRYGHLLPGAGEQAARMLDALLDDAAAT